MKQKKFRKLCMAHGMSRNEVNELVNVVKTVRDCRYTAPGVVELGDRFSQDGKKMAVVSRTVVPDAGE